MKKIYYTIAVAILSVSACTKPEAVVEFGLDRDSIEIGPEGGVQSVKVNVAGRWTAELAEPWALVSPSSGVGETVCQVRIDSTLLNDERSLKIRFNDKDGKKSQLINVVQEGFKKRITVSEPEISLENYASPDKRTFNVDVTANVPFTVKIDGNEDKWLKTEVTGFEPGAKARPRTKRIRFTWDGNSGETPRIADVTFVTDEPLEVHEAVKVTQDRAPEITDDRRGDSLAIVIIKQKLNIRDGGNNDEPLEYWSNVTLWKESDKECKADPEMKGRVRSVQFAQFSTSLADDEKGLPAEFAKLRYLETLSLFSNGNKHLRHIRNLGGITELTRLKHLQLYYVGLVDLPEDFKNLRNLEVLDLTSNNFSRIPAVLTPENFPKLTELSLAINARSEYRDLDLLTVAPEEAGGFYMGIKEGRDPFKTLLSWKKLKKLVLSNNLFVGEIPDMLDYAEKYTVEDIKAAGDTLATATYDLVGTPKVLPYCTDFRMGLNYFTGKLPEWLLYHPKLMLWNPDISVFNQKRYNDDNGNLPGFSNVPASYDYYWTAYPFWADKMSGK